MSRIAYFDCASGASGDMVLGALVDLGLPLDRLRAELAKLPLTGYRLEARKVERAGIQATKVHVVVEGETPDIDDSAQKITSFYHDDQGKHIAAIILVALSALC